MLAYNYKLLRLDSIDLLMLKLSSAPRAPCPVKRYPLNNTRAQCTLSHGSRVEVRGSRFVVRGSWFVLHGSLMLVRGSWFVVPWFPGSLVRGSLVPWFPGSRVPGSRFQVPVGGRVPDGSRRVAQGARTPRPPKTPPYRGCVRFSRTTDHACSVTFGVKGLQDKLRKLGVLQNKHIPLAYLQADVSQRRWLLKGLMDTDGTVGKRGQCVFCQSNYDFIVQVRELLCSLGIKNSLIELDAKIGEKNYGKTWRICFYAKDIAHLDRKEERTIKTALKNGRYIRVEKLGTTGDTQCIRVDREDGLFLAGEGFICTHNTKSEFSSYLLPAFIMGRQPKTKIIQATHTGELAVRFGRKVRNLMDTDEYKQVFSDVALRADSKAAGRWDTDHGGEYFACLRPYALVHTDRGQVPAGEIKQGDVLLNCGKAVTVQDVYHSKHKATYNIAGLDCSSNHPIWTMNRGWVYAADVVPTDVLCAESIWNKARMLWKCKKADNTDITPSLLRGKNELETYGVPKGIGTVRRKTAKLVGRIKNLFVQDLCGLLLGVRLAGHVSRTTHQDEGFINFLTDGDHTFFAEGVLTHNCGVGGAMTGRGADLLIIDDPHSEQDALSELAMDNAWEWYTSGPRQRLQPGGSVVVVMCMTGDTNVLMADGSTTKLKDIRPGDKVATYEEGSITTSKINNWKSNGVDSIYTITTQSGIILRANERHPFLVEIEGKRQWIRLRDLKKGMQLVATKDVSDLHDLRQSPDYALHAKHGNHITEKTLTPLTTLSDITGNGKEKNAGVENLYHQGDYVLLATGKNTNRLHGLLKKTEQLVLNTVMGSHLISMTKWLKSETIDVIYAAKSLLRKTQERIGMESCVLTTTMTQGPSEDCYATTATCPLGMEKHPKTSKEPLSIYSVITDKIADIKYTGEEEVFDIEVDRTENFIANGVVSHNTRWNTKDLTARLVKAQTSHNADRWEVIEFPAILPSEKPMWPEFWKLEELLAVKASLSPQKWQAQWQQQPSNDEGAILKREWWRVWPSEEPPPVEYIIQSYDTAYSKKETADYSAITTWGVFYPDQDSGPNIILLDATKGRWDFPELKRIAKDQYDQWQPDNVLIEAKATGITLQQELRRMGIPVTMYSPGGRRAGQDKVSRAHSVAPLFEAGMVWAPDTDWAEDLVEECAAFPNGDNDDLVDSCFVAGTQILMEDGTTKSIEKIKVGEKVMTPNGPRSVTKTFDNGFKEIWELATSTSTLHVTHDHLIKTSRGWIPVDKLQVMCDTTVQCQQQENFSWLLNVMTKLKKKACTLMEESTTDTQIVLTKHTGGILHAQAPDYTAMFGSIIRDLSPVGMLFTTLTETRQTTELKILHVYRNMPICKSIMKKWLIGEKARSNDCILNTFEKKPRSGTNRKKEDNGIKNTLLSLWKRLEKKLKSMDILKKKLHVYGVVKNLQALRFNVSFAHRDAKMLNLGLGEVKHVHNTHTMHRVYDIEVEEEHCYFAEGVLVHNCVQALNRFRAGNFISLTSDFEDEEKQQDVAFEYY
jgi:predicted phage terminase large subunit-like protein